MMPVFVGLAAALLALALVIAQTVLAQREARMRAMNEGETQLAFHAIMQAVLEAESSQRGYVLTRDGGYRLSYLEAKNRLIPAIGNLRAVAARAGDAETSGRIGWIVSMADAKFAEMDRTIALTGTGLQAQALLIVNSDIGKQQMDAVRAAIAGETARAAAERRRSFERAATLEVRLIPLFAVLSLALLLLVIAGFRSERSRALAAAEAEQAAALREANDRAQLLARELNHRVKNLFSVILSIVALSGRKPSTSAEVVESIRARIHALSLAHATSQGATGTASVAIGPVIARTMEPYADEEGRRVRISGADVTLPARMLTPIGLIIHELATNALKYGALSAGGGQVEIRWDVDQAGDTAELTLRWVESGGPAVAFAGGEPATAGFGSKMTTLAAHQLGGSITREWLPSGAVIRLTFPLPPS